MNKILERFPGAEVKPKTVKREVEGVLRDVEKRDILGADLFYCREEGWTCWSMEGAIERMLKVCKFSSGGRGRVTTPCQPHVDLTEGEPRPDYPIRQVVGSLLYIATVGRPDALFAATKLARHAANCTASVVTAAKHLLRYLDNTKPEGLVYSPARHARFNEKYKDLFTAVNRDI